MEPVRNKPKKVKIDENLKNDLKILCEEESQVIVHCSVLITHTEYLRIWKNTNLIAHGTGKKSSMTHAENISFHPLWTQYSKGQHNFTLFFKALPKSCQVFDLIEDIPELGGFIKKNIKRNKIDVYHVKL
tara:strand:+ start:199 stop:588 length:390 start_codon:yes stop_codon:yes gene_type:complete